MKQTTRGGVLAVALTAAVSLALAGVVPTAQGATVPEKSTSAGQVGTYLAAHGDHFASVYEGTEYPDYGLTLDGVLALDAGRVGRTGSDRALAYVGDHLTSYVGDGETVARVGGTAKALLAALANGKVVDGAFGGVRLADQLVSLEQPSGRFTDRYDESNEFDADYSSTVSQSLALIALPRSGSAVSQYSKRYLRAQQCADGGFRIDLDAETCTSDVDATSYAVQALIANPNASNNAALAKATDYLRTRQVTGGGVKGGPDNAANANTTALAVVAMRAAGRTGFADRGVAYLTSLRYGCSFPAALRGLVAYDVASKDAARTRPVDTTPTDKELRSTTQAVLGLSGVTYAKVTSAGAGTTLPVLACA